MYDLKLNDLKFLEHVRLQLASYTLLNLTWQSLATQICSAKLSSDEVLCQPSCYEISVPNLLVIFFKKNLVMKY